MAAPDAVGHGERSRVGVSSFFFLSAFFTGKKEKDIDKEERIKDELRAAIHTLDRVVGAKGEDKECVEKVSERILLHPTILPEFGTYGSCFACLRLFSNWRR
ncbi:hypothetical protein GUJ93_ZPchr0004g38944 [Zizania palustris]|uniref:Uncharacterized protein n=1 Tax=Zizania palustris TaxID=103762 RepID=A0A8J5S1D6_ZIZPA|nr:hypothetical protein GUJ93_ZPchr0004g38944 [Zizania palustris]